MSSPPLSASMVSSNFLPLAYRGDCEFSLIQFCESVSDGVLRIQESQHTSHVVLLFGSECFVHGHVALNWDLRRR